MENNQTAIDWLEDNLIGNPHSEEDFKHNINIWGQAKQMEKEQIIEARLDGFASSGEGWNGEYPIMKYTEMLRETKCEEYYNETYNKQDNGK